MIEFHPVADLFPMMSDQESTDLLESIAANGLREPIWLYDGQIIDGRNRYRACLESGVAPEFREYSGDASGLVPFVLDLNLHRRHLNESQRSMVGARVANMKRGDNQHVGIPTTSQGDAAQMVNVSRDSVSLAKRVQDFGTPDMVADVEAGNLAVSKAAELVKVAEKDPQKVAEVYEEYKRDHSVHFTSNTPEWYTPPHIIERAVALLGAIDLDPCSNSHEDPNVPAATVYTADDDGLSKEWHGRVYLNPPYGGGLGDWVRKLTESHAAGTVGEAIVLVPARTDTAWFAVLRDWPRCFVSGRLKFSGSANSAPFPSAVFYLGERTDVFAKTFGDIGDVYVRYSED